MTDPGDTQPGKPVRRQPPPAQPPAPVPAPPPPPVQVSGTVGGDVAGRDVNKELNAGRDIVGRDVVTNTSTSTSTTIVGFSPKAVMQLVLSVGILVFVTAACFFSGGIFVGGAALVALERPVNSNNEAAARRFADKLAVLQSLPAGQSFQMIFTEEEIRS